MADFRISIGNDQQRNDDDQNHQHQNRTQIEHQPELVLLNKMDDRKQYDRTQYQDIAVKLQRAALKGNKKEVDKFLNNGADLRWAITRGHETLLHVATGAKQTALVKLIIERMEPNDLMLQDRNGNTAFCFAAAVGATKIADMMLKKNGDLATLRSFQNKTPLYMAVFFGRRKMAEKLIKLHNEENSRNNLTEEDKKKNLTKGDITDIFLKSIETGLYDFALELLKKNSYLAVARTRYGGETALHVLARQPSAFHGKSVHNLILGVLNLNGNPAIELVRCLWKNITVWPEENIIPDIIRNPSKLLFDVTKSGNFGFLAEIIKEYPDLIHQLDEHGRSIFHVAVLHRHSDIFSLIYQTGYLNKELLLSFVDSSHNNILHLAAKCQNLPSVSSEKGAALKMQRELLFFKEIESIVPPHFKDMKNKVGEPQLTPQELFSKEHEDLLKRGVAWMKNAAKSCLVVATIITTVIFTATYTVPGGTAAHNDIHDHNSTVAEGSPIHLNKTLFKIFSTSNVIGLSFSTVSILMFLSILLSGFAEKDFIWFLPLKLFVGLVTLLFSIISMMVTYSSTYFLAYPYHERLNWITMTTVLLVSVPIIICAQVLFPLLGDILRLLCRGIYVCFLKPVLVKINDLLEMVHDFVVYI
ncbi:hypothetical protein Dsin_029463 [Dipteronia sinensis]|uniref:PGG domain-containing protein n=1 Tax=Dipteronia sinensis TaxID=43782 RepID=A0AAD9ZSR1_9ROSI|nr:hypothetical protein Dsin_029463 [Dipteronia sinensis]